MHKKLLIIAVALLFTNCEQAAQTVNKVVRKTNQVTTIVKTTPAPQPPVQNPDLDSCAFYKRQIDTLKHKLYMTYNAVVKVDYYLGLVDKNPKYIKYLKGWTKRALLQTKPKGK